MTPAPESDTTVIYSRGAVAVGTVAGLAFMAVGVWFAFGERERTHPFELARWVIASDFSHDLLVAPVALVVGWGLGRVLPSVARNPVRWATATSGVLAVYAWPFIRAYGRKRSIPSLLNRDYARGLLAYLVVTWVVAALWIAINTIRARRGSVDSPRGPDDAAGDQRRQPWPGV